MIRAGVDVGGTFTDVILEWVKDDGSREIVVTKVSSTPQNQSEGVVKGVKQVCEMAGVSVGDIDILYPDGSRWRGLLNRRAKIRLRKDYSNYREKSHE